MMGLTSFARSARRETKLRARRTSKRQSLAVPTSIQPPSSLVPSHPLMSTLVVRLQTCAVVISTTRNVELYQIHNLPMYNCSMEKRLTFPKMI